MVFGWGKKNRAQVQKTEETVERSVAISDVSQIVTDTLKIHSKTIVSETSSLHSRMDNLFADLAKIISKLDGDDLQIGDVDRNIRVIVERGKKQVIKIIKEESERPLQKISKPEDIEKFVADAKRRIKRTGDALGRHSRVINLFAKKYAIRIKDIMKNLESSLNQSIKLSEDNAARNDNASVILEGLKEIDDLGKMSESKTHRIKDAEDESIRIQDLLKKTQKDISEIKDGKNYAVYLDGCKKLNMHDKRAQDERKIINEQFTKISRPLVKYEYVSAMDKERKILLGVLCNDPYLALHKGSVKDIQSILSTVRAGVVGGTVSVKDSDRSSAAIDEILAQVPEFVKSLKSLKSERENLASEIAKLFDVKHLESLESSVLHEKRRLEDQKNLIDSMREESESALRKIPEIIALLQKNLRSLTNISYTLHD